MVAAVLLVVAVAALILVFSRSGRTVGTGEGTSWWDGNVALPAVLLPGIILVLASVATLSAWAAGSLPEVLASLFPGRSGSRGRRHRNAGGVPPDRLRLRVGPPIRVRDGRCENISAPPGRWEPVFSIGMLIWHRSVLSPRRLIDRVLRVRPLWRFDEQRVTFVRRRRRPARERRSLWVIPLEVEDEARGEDWERRLAAAAPPASARTIVFARFGSGRYPPVADWPADPGPAQTYRGPRHLRPDDARPASTVIVQAIGTPVHTMSGMRLRVSDDGPNPSAAGEETLLGIEDLDVSGIPLAVLQADPVDGAAAPLGEDRAGFVDLAIAALDAGAGAVLVIPPLPDELAAAVGAAVQETVVLGMRDGLGRDGRLLAPVYAARRVKDLIYDEVSRDGETSGVTGEPAASESGPGAMGTIAVDDARPGDDVLLFLR